MRPCYYPKRYFAPKPTPQKSTYKSKAKPKKHYNVYRRIAYGFGNNGYSEMVTEAMNEYEKIGDVWAVSEKDAINKIRFRVFGLKETNYGYFAEEI